MTGKLPERPGRTWKTFIEGGEIGSRLLNIARILLAVIAFSLAIMVSIKFQLYDGILVVGIVIILILIQFWIMKNCIKNTVVEKEKNIKYPFLKRLMGFFSEPTITFRQLRDDPLTTALSHFFFVLISFFIIYLVTQQVPESAYNHTLPDIGSGILLAISNGIYWIFTGIVVHMVLKGSKSGEDIVQTAKVMAYAVSPLALFAFVPVFGFLWSVWGLGLVYLGLREFHGLPQGKALFAAIVVPLLATALLWFMLSMYWPEILII